MASRHLRPLVPYAQSWAKICAYSYCLSLGTYMCGAWYLGHEAGYNSAELDRIVSTDCSEKRVFNRIQAVGWAAGLPFQLTGGLISAGKDVVMMVITAGPIRIF